MGRCGGTVVSALAFYFDNPSSNPAGYIFYLLHNGKTTINEKWPGLACLKMTIYGQSCPRLILRGDAILCFA